MGSGGRAGRAGGPRRPRSLNRRSRDGIDVIEMRPSTLGLLVGGIIGLLLVIISLPQLLLVVFLGIVGFLLGKLAESEEVRAKVNELVSLIFRR